MSTKLSTYNSDTLTAVINSKHDKTLTPIKLSMVSFSAYTDAERIIRAFEKAAYDRAVADVNGRMSRFGGGS